MTTKIRSYDALALHLNPDDPADGARQIDTAILTLQRARYRPRNWGRASFWLANILQNLGFLVLVARAACWLAGELWRSFVGTFATMMPIWAAVLLIVAAIGLHAIYWRLSADDRLQLPVPPEPIHQWLVAHGKSDLRYWAETYWPYVKILAHRRDVFGFVLWRKNPRPLDQYPPAAVRAAVPDPHWTYIRSAEGRADSAAYEIDFEQRLEAWRGLCVRGALAVVAVLGAAIWLPIYPPTAGGHLLRIGLTIAFVFISMRLAFGLATMPMRWLPAAFRRYWFRDLPPEAERFRDHMLAISD